MPLTAVELCAGGGGQAVGLEGAAFKHLALVEYEAGCCTTLRANRPEWNTIQEDVREFRGSPYVGADLVAAGVPCPPFSVAGKQLGADDERDMFPATMEVIRAIRPRAVLIENVPGLSQARFQTYRDGLVATLSRLGYATAWQVLQAADYGVAQLRPRFVLVGFRDGGLEAFRWPTPISGHMTVGEALVGQMSSRGWRGATSWARRANTVAPTVVGGSKKHGGPDLGPSRAKEKWRSLGVDPMGIVDQPPDAAFRVDGSPRLTIAMVAQLQGFPADWRFWGPKTIAYRQVGNAFPPPVAKAVGEAIGAALHRTRKVMTAGVAQRASNARGGGKIVAPPG